MKSLIKITLLGLIRDRVLQALMLSSLLMLAIPSVSSLSMRQVTELSITLSLSFISFLLLLISVFLGSTAIWRDMERRYTFSVQSLPVTRSSYMLGKFSAIAACIAFVAILLGALSIALILSANSLYPSARPIAWDVFLAALVFTVLKYALLTAFAFLFSSISTSFFLPVFGTLVTFLVGSASQQVYDFVTSSASRELPAFLKFAGTALYYVLPNFSAFDLTVNAVYSIELQPVGMMLSFAYGVVYTAMVLALACLVYAKRELQ